MHSQRPQSLQEQWKMINEERAKRYHEKTSNLPLVIHQLTSLVNALQAEISKLSFPALGTDIFASSAISHRYRTTLMTLQAVTLPFLQQIEELLADVYCSEFKSQPIENFSKETVHKVLALIAKSAQEDDVEVMENVRKYLYPLIMRLHRIQPDLESALDETISRDAAMKKKNDTVIFKAMRIKKCLSAMTGMKLSITKETDQTSSKIKPDRKGLGTQPDSFLEAVAHGNMAAMEWLYGLHPECIKSTSAGNSSLDIAILNNETKAVKWLLKKHKFHIDKENENRQTAIDLAIENKNFKLLRLIIEGGMYNSIGGIVSSLTERNELLAEFMHKCVIKDLSKQKSIDPLVRYLRYASSNNFRFIKLPTGFLLKHLDGLVRSNKLNDALELARVLKNTARYFPETHLSLFESITQVYEAHYLAEKEKKQLGNDETESSILASYASLLSNTIQDQLALGASYERLNLYQKAYDVYRCCLGGCSKEDEKKASEAMASILMGGLLDKVDAIERGILFFADLAPILFNSEQSWHRLRARMMLAGASDSVVCDVDSSQLLWSIEGLRRFIAHFTQNQSFSFGISAVRYDRISDKFALHEISNQINLFISKIESNNHELDSEDNVFVSRILADYVRLASTTIEEKMKIASLYQHTNRHNDAYHLYASVLQEGGTSRSQCAINMITLLIEGRVTGFDTFESAVKSIKLLNDHVSINDRSSLLERIRFNLAESNFGKNSENSLWKAEYFQRFCSCFLRKNNHVAKQEIQNQIRLLNQHRSSMEAENKKLKQEQSSFAGKFGKHLLFSSLEAHVRANHGVTEASPVQAIVDHAMHFVNKNL